MENIEQKNPHFVIFLNVLGLIGLSIVLMVAFYYQLVRFELPCPLCLLQRVGLILAGCGFLLNIHHKVKNTHYGMVILGCMVTSIVAARQVFLHITPDDLGYGSTFFGLHFYTWAFIISVLCILAVSCLMILSEVADKFKTFTPFPILSKMASFLFIFLIAANLVSTVLECGGGQCADDPVRYELLSSWFPSSY
ncbi:disulfide bond formation protein DsbB [Bartonella callosciuri]|uniref:Disulfide bond formation protein DsbB n=1 Tax=Bartonella callosciuri TaxID=686223 RepID=A0A840NYI8_9HYPH|nr:disulfide bond formation protein B [Bartonella callosciuri]MBB5074309.1 disulfide bond formation protein DsbB [Bartonella callosciuri]